MRAWLSTIVIFGGGDIREGGKYPIIRRRDAAAVSEWLAVERVDRVSELYSAVPTGARTSAPADKRPPGGGAYLGGRAYPATLGRWSASGVRSKCPLPLLMQVKSAFAH